MQYREDKVRWISDESIQDALTLQIYSSVPTFLRAMQKVYKDDISYPFSFFDNFTKVSNTRIVGTDGDANIHVMMFLLKLEEIEYCYNQMRQGNLECELEFPFYFTYHPPIIDERVKNQSSVFVLQPFSTNTHFFNGEPAQVWQKIMPDFTIEIHNPEKIKRALDAVGFNLKHIYCDYDSIAKYTISSSR